MLATRRALAPLASRSLSTQVIAAAAEKTAAQKTEVEDGAPPHAHRRFMSERVLRLVNSGFLTVKDSVSLYAGVKSKIFEILTDTKPMTSAEIWAEAEVRIPQNCWTCTPVLHACAVDRGSISMRAADTFAAHLYCLPSCGPPCADFAAVEEGRAQQAAHEDDATGPTAAGVGGHQAWRGGDSQEGQGVPLRAQRENAHQPAVQGAAASCGMRHRLQSARCTVMGVLPEQIIGSGHPARKSDLARHMHTQLCQLDPPLMGTGCTWPVQLLNTANCRTDDSAGLQPATGHVARWPPVL